MPSLLICPICAEPLADVGGSFVCARRHTFDRAREGYIDLLPPGHGRTNIPGDSAEMVGARRRFLAAGHYAQLVDAVLDMLRAHEGDAGSAARDDAWRVLDVGCGEGYYGGRVAESIASTSGACELYGLDISRRALRLAARSHRHAVFFVNDVAARICVADGTIDVLLDIFAPRNAGEFARVLRPGGLAVAVIPTESHLHELRAALPLIAIPAGKREHTLDQLASHLNPVAECALEYAMDLTRDDALDLLRMSPSAHHVDEEQLRARTGEASVTASFTILGFSRPNS